VLAGALVLPGAAFAAEGTSGYGSTPTTPTTTTPTTPKTTPTTPTSTTPATEPKTGTSPSKEKSASETAPESKSAEKATSLPFTGLDLRWVIVVGVLLMGAGLSIVLVQRRQRRDGGR
jgi:uncharacterized surface anchored protein